MAIVNQTKMLLALDKEFKLLTIGLPKSIDSKTGLEMVCCDGCKRKSPVGSTSFVNHLQFCPGHLRKQKALAAKHAAEALAAKHAAEVLAAKHAAAGVTKNSKKGKKSKSKKGKKSKNK